MIDVFLELCQKCCYKEKYFCGKLQQRERETQYSSDNNARQAGDHYSPHHLRHQSLHPRADPHHWWPNPRTILLLLGDGGPGTRPSPSPLMPLGHTQKNNNHTQRKKPNKQTDITGTIICWLKKETEIQLWVQRERELKTMRSDETDEVD